MMQGLKCKYFSETRIQLQVISLVGNPRRCLKGIREMMVYQTSSHCGHLGLGVSGDLRETAENNH